MIDGAFYVDGKVALRYYQPIPKHVKVGNKDYIFQCGHGISLIFVPEEEVPPLLNFLGGCCGGRKKVISLCSQVLYSHWLDGQGGR
jgi:hypothetical protein